MKATVLTKKQFESLEPLKLPNGIYNTEGRLYTYKAKDKWTTIDKVLKKFYITSGQMFGNKLETINSLIDSKAEIDIDEIVTPDSIAIVGDDVVGFIMPLITSINFNEAMNDPKLSYEQKIDLLKQVGAILEKMKQVRQHTNIKDFYLNDLHEDNFVIDLTDLKVKAVDLDSCKILGNNIFGSKYLSSFSPIESISKYEKTHNGICGGYFEVSEDTDLYCYIIMILNFLYGNRFYRLPLEDIYEYFNYLKSIGVPKELVDMFNNVFTNKKNENPYKLLTYLPPYVDKCREYVRVRH